MNNTIKKDLLFLVQDAGDSCIYQHLYLRGNFQMDMFYDKVDFINAWNRIWLSARATEVQILSAVILNNHFHISAIIDSDEQRADFKHHLRLSLTQYHNRRHNVHGTLGTRTLKQSILKDMDDLKDCICYHIRNTLHHNVYPDYLNYPFNTGRFVFNLATRKQKGVYTQRTMPEKLGCYLPASKELPNGWLMTEDGMIVPPPGVFHSDIIEAIFSSREEYLEQLSHRTIREDTDNEEPTIGTPASHSRGCQDEQIVEFVKENFHVDIPSLNDSQKMDTIFKIRKVYPDVSRKLLTRLFGIPDSTLRFRLKNWHPRE